MISKRNKFWCHMMWYFRRTFVPFKLCLILILQRLLSRHHGILVIMMIGFSLRVNGTWGAMFKAGLSQSAVAADTPPPTIATSPPIESLNLVLLSEYAHAPEFVPSSELAIVSPPIVAHDLGHWHRQKNPSKKLEDYLI